jgi:3-phosphoshikimate 1-carboxyvinyltransferase
MTTRVEPAAALTGHIRVPGDKSISHRAALLGAVGEGETRIVGFGRAADTESTLGAVRALGAEVVDEDVDLVRIGGVGLRGLRPPGEPIDAGNSGTLIRLLSGLLAGQEGEFTITGDASLRSRPMERVAEPLRQMGAEVETTEGHAPVTVRGGELEAIRYRPPMPSAQVKSAVLLAGLYAGGGETTVEEGRPTRDHTELLLRQAGVRVALRRNLVSVAPPSRLELGTVQVPGDFSAAAPFIVAATLLAGSHLYVHDVGVNPTRTGLLDVLERMGAHIAVFNRRRLGGEPVADLEVRSAALTATEVTPGEVPRLIDELPLFALAAASARGESVVRGAGELRHKETDRIETVKEALKALGVRVSSGHDVLGVRGVPSRPKGGGVASHGDHRLAILGGVAGVVSREGVRVEGAEAAAVSFPGFFELLESVTER